jgi:hypothetical protein
VRVVDALEALGYAHDFSQSVDVHDSVMPLLPPHSTDTGRCDDASLCLMSLHVAGWSQDSYMGFVTLAKSTNQCMDGTVSAYKVYLEWPRILGLRHFQYETIIFGHLINRHTKYFSLPRIKNEFNGHSGLFFVVKRHPWMDCHSNICASSPVSRPFYMTGYTVTFCRLAYASLCWQLPRPSIII